MPRLDFPLLPDGLLVDAIVGLDRTTTKAQITAGQPVTRPIVTRGEIDTGTNMSAVSRAVLRQHGVPIQYQTTTRTASGQLTADVFEVSVGIRNLADSTGTELVEPQLLVMELPTALPNIEVLIGLDILIGCRLVLDGPARRFSLEF